jgi:hypothetical protein
MLHLNVQRADIACAQHSHAGHERAHAATESHAGHQSAHGNHQAASESKSCETPVQADCCQALVSCSMGLGLSDSQTAVPLASFHDAAHALLLSKPHSRVTAPEPPPPKA